MNRIGMVFSIVREWCQELRKLISNKKADSNYKLGMALVKQRNYIAAHPYILKAANHNHAEALYELANMSANNLIQSKSEAPFQWYSFLFLAEKFGSKQAKKFRLAFNIDTEQLKQEVKLQMEEHGHLYKLTEEEADKLGIYALLLEKEILDEKIQLQKHKIYADKLTLERYSKYAKQGNPIAMLEIAELYRWGKSVEVSYLKSYMWAKLSLLNGNSNAQQLVDDMENYLLSQEDLSEAKSQFEAFCKNYKELDIA
jgi:TPR repeat protein